MKKKLSTILAAISLTMISSVNAKQMERKKAVSTSTRKSSARQISEATDALKDAVKNIQIAPVAEKEIARQEANDAVADVLATLHERTWTGDLRGYSEDQIKKAGEKLELLYAEEKNLDSQIKAQQLKIDEMTDKGWLWNAPKESKKEEHKEASTELKNLKTKLAKVKSAIKSEEVIAGKTYALSIKRAVYVIGAAAAAGTAYAIDAYYFDSKGKAYLSEQLRKLGTYFGVYTQPGTKEKLIEAVEQGKQAIAAERAARQTPTIGQIGEVVSEPAYRATQRGMESIAAERAGRQAPTTEEIIGEILQERQNVIQAGIESEEASKAAMKAAERLQIEEQEAILASITAEEVAEKARNTAQAKEMAQQRLEAAKERKRKSTAAAAQRLSPRK